MRFSNVHINDSGLTEDAVQERHRMRPVCLSCGRIVFSLSCYQRWSREKLNRYVREA
jgi:hypothetical protein